MTVTLARDARPRQHAASQGGPRFVSATMATILIVVGTESGNAQRD
jgi:hypothetical protein